MPDENDPFLIEALGRVHAHLSEVYRLHRRVLRHRRRTVSGLTPDRSGATSSTTHQRHGVAVRGSRGLALRRNDSVQRVPSGEYRPDRVRIFAQVLDHLSQYSQSGRGAFDFLARQTHLIGDAELFGRIVRRLGSADIFEARTQALVDALRPLLGGKQQFVIFCSDAKTADTLASALVDRLRLPVDRHGPEDERWLTFNLDTGRAILVCDRRAEEGLNLQGGRKIVVHYDLPLDPNRVEQRLGRADRYGSGDAVSLVLYCHDDPIEAAWIDYLNSGLRVFDRSVASLQYLIEDTTRTLAGSLFAEGPEALNDLTKEGAGEDGMIECEMRDIDQQDALDALGTPAGDLLEALTLVDDDWRAIEASDCMDRTVAALFPPYRTRGGAAKSQRDRAFSLPLRDLQPAHPHPARDLLRPLPSRDRPPLPRSSRGWFAPSLSPIAGVRRSDVRGAPSAHGSCALATHSSPACGRSRRGTIAAVRPRCGGMCRATTVTVSPTCSFGSISSSKPMSAPREGSCTTPTD